VWLAVDRAGAHLDAASSDPLASLGNHVCDIWSEPDCGIWELEERRHNTFSKAGCWVARDPMTSTPRSCCWPGRGFLAGGDKRFW